MPLTPDCELLINERTSPTKMTKDFLLKSQKTDKLASAAFAKWTTKEDKEKSLA